MLIHSGNMSILNFTYNKLFKIYFVHFDPIKYICIFVPDKQTYGQEKLLYMAIDAF